MSLPPGLTVKNFRRLIFFLVSFSPFVPPHKSQIFGILFILVSSAVLEKYSDLHANVMLCIFLAVGVVMTASIRNKLKRQNAFENNDAAEELS